MAYEYEYINELIQFNKKTVTLFLVDSDGVLAPIRIEKQFCAITSTEQDMIDSALLDIDYYTNNQPQLNIVGEE